MYYSFVFVSLATVHVHIANIVMKISLLFHSFYYSIVLYIHIANNIIMKISLLLHRFYYIIYSIVFVSLFIAYAHNIMKILLLFHSFYSIVFVYISIHRNIILGPNF